MSQVLESFGELIMHCPFRYANTDNAFSDAHGDLDFLYCSDDLDTANPSFDSLRNSAAAGAQKSHSCCLEKACSRHFGNESHYYVLSTVIRYFTRLRPCAKRHAVRRQTLATLRRVASNCLFATRRMSSYTRFPKLSWYLNPPDP